MSEVSNVNNPFAKKLEKVIEQHHSDPGFSIDLLCREMGMSRSQLHRKTKAATGVSTTHFVRKVRLKMAIHLLETTDLNISEIAYEIGINSRKCRVFTHFQHRKKLNLDTLNKPAILI